MLTTQKSFNISNSHNLASEDIIRTLNCKKFEKGNIFPDNFNNLWLLKKGIVKTLTYSERGKTIILGYWGEGDVVGLPLSKVEPYEIHCLNDVEAIKINEEQYSCLSNKILCCIRQTDELLRIVRIEKMYSRLVKVLIWLAHKFGLQTLHGIIINIRLTHQDIADIIGSTRVTVTRLLNQLDREELIFRPRRFSIIVKDVNLLQKQLKLEE